jgi:hypothetical protein
MSLRGHSTSRSSGIQEFNSHEAREDDSYLRAPGPCRVPVAMASRTVEASPQAYARIGGALYLVIIVFGAFAEGFVANKLIAPGDAATTAHNIMAAPGLWQFSVAGDLRPSCYLTSQAISGRTSEP